jgi:hypothetical protein
MPLPLALALLAGSLAAAGLAGAAAGNTVVAGSARLTILTDSLVRMEWAAAPLRFNDMLARVKHVSHVEMYRMCRNAPRPLYMYGPVPRVGVPTQLSSVESVRNAQRSLVESSLPAAHSPVSMERSPHSLANAVTTRVLTAG